MNSSAHTRVFVVGVCVAIFVISLHLWGKKDTDDRTARDQAYSQTQGAREERATRVQLEELEVKKIEARAVLENAKRLGGKILLLPPNGAVCQDGRPPLAGHPC